MNASEVIEIIEGRKDDEEKPPLFQGVLSYFPNALNAVADVSAYGAKKYNVPYENRNFLHVPNAVERYLNAALRHISEFSEKYVDPESSEPHLAHAAWCLLAALECDIRDMSNLEREYVDEI